jgi:hypothetical protein
MTLQEAFQEAKTRLELDESFSELVTQKHNAVRSFVQNSGIVPNTQLIGSLQRRTRIQPRTEDIFDIDILVILGEFSQWTPSGITPSMALNQLQSIVTSSERYGSMGPAVDAPVITFEYADGVKVELVPAYKDKIGACFDGTPTVKGRGFWVPKSTGFWELADYDYEADLVTSVNQKNDELIIPTIKMLKAIKRKHFPTMSSFHLEIIATQVLPARISLRKVLGLPTDFSDLITDFFSVVDFNRLSLPTKMLGSCSPVVAIDLNDKLIIANKFTEISRYLNSISQTASESEKIAKWRELMDEVIPSI